MMPERKLSSNYRYGFNGKENDNEINTEGNQQDYGMRIYDPRVGRFLSVDPITGDYPELTPYQFASNRPIDGIDLDGLEWYPFMKQDPKTGKMVVDGEATLKQMRANSQAAMNIIKIPIEILGRITQIIDDVNLANSDRLTRGQQKFYSKRAGDNMALLSIDAAMAYTYSRIFRFFGPVVRNIQETEFAVGGSHITTSLRLSRYPESQTYGASELFIAPKGQIDKLLKSGKSRKDIEKALGLNPGALEGGDLIRIDILPTEMKNLRLPIGIESGANANFIPGGKTSGGISEAVIDAVSKKSKGVTKTTITEKKYN